MANEEQLKLLKQGVDVWNRWREENPNAQIGLKKADLERTFLAGINLRGACLEGADLQMANFTEADLSEADLRETNLIGTNLSSANLNGAILFGSSPGGTNLTNALLRETNLSGSHPASVIFVDLDLSETKGLEEVSHEGPSPISTSTLERSKGKIPEIFLRGCGLSDWEIESAKLYKPKLSLKQVTDITNKVCQLRAGSPIQYYSCFISYSSEDDAFARRLHNDLQDNGVRCWFAPDDLKIGDKFRGRIDDAIQVHDKLLIVLSENSIYSNWVEKEVETAFEKEKAGGGIVLFPIRLDDAVMNTDKAWAADIRRTRHIGDFSNCKDKENYQKAYERLLRDLKAAGKEKE